MLERTSAPSDLANPAAARQESPADCVLRLCCAPRVSGQRGRRLVCCCQPLATPAVMQCVGRRESEARDRGRGERPVADATAHHHSGDGAADEQQHRCVEDRCFPIIQSVAATKGYEKP